MSAVPGPIETSAPSRASREEPVAAWILTCFLGMAVLSIFVSQRQDLIDALRSQGIELLFWTVLIVVVNLLPLNLGEITLTLDMPILLAVALLYQPAVAGFLGVLAAIDLREVERRVPLLRAVFNRFQVGLCVIASSVVFHAAAGSTQPTLRAAWGTIAAIGAFHSTNVVLVIGYTWLRIHAWNRLTVGGVFQFLITYLGYGALALVLARLYRDIGAWSVVTLVIPILVAREALLRAQSMQSLADRLRERGRLLERLSDRIVDERKDERFRIGAELHDDVLQSLIRISQLGHFLRKETTPNSAAAEDAAEIVEVSDQAIQELRDVVTDLRASPVGRGGLLPTLRSLGRDLQLDWRIPVKVDAMPDLKLSGDEQLLFYQVAKEAVINALKHASPSEVSVRLGEKDSCVFLEVRDDGKGFKPESVDTSQHFGLGLIRERVECRRGRFDLTSQQGSGTSLSVYLPREINLKGSPRIENA